MKKAFLSFFLLLLMIPAFSLGFEFDFFTGTGFTAGFTSKGDVFNRSWGIWFDSRDVEYSYKKTSGYNTYSGTYKDTRKTVGPYMQFDWTLLPFNIAGIAKLGFNLGFKTAIGYVSSKNEQVDMPFDMILAPMISAVGRWNNLDVTLGWQGALHLAEFFKGNRVNEDDELKKGGWVNSFQIGVKYVIGGRHSSSSNGTTEHSEGTGSQSIGGRTTIINGSGMSRTK